MASNTNLHVANIVKKDEFYTQLSDIERELKYYRHHFAGKVVFCNCDDPYESNFFKYFALNFNALGLKKLIATCYNGSPVSGNELLLDFGDTVDDPKKIAYKVEINEVRDFNGDGAINLADVQYLIQNDKNVISILKENGDFRSKECVELLKEADIVVTNPPFSLFREYIALLMQYEKKFVIIGNKNAITYKEVFKYIAANKLWIGMTPMSKEIYFDVPQSYIDEALEKHKDRSVVRVNNKYVARSQSIWYTNLDIPKRHEEIPLFKLYSPEEYPKYDNYDAINVDVTNNIPKDYYEIMGVPISFMDKYNPQQFEILGLDDHRVEWRGKGPELNGKVLYRRIIIRRKK